MIPQFATVAVIAAAVLALTCLFPREAPAVSGYGGQYFFDHPTFFNEHVTEQLAVPYTNPEAKEQLPPIADDVFRRSYSQTQLDSSDSASRLMIPVFSEWADFFSFCNASDNSTGDYEWLEGRCAVPNAFLRHDLFPLPHASAGRANASGLRALRRVLRGVVRAGAMELESIAAGWVTEAVVVVGNEWDDGHAHALRLVHSTLLPDLSVLRPGTRAGGVSLPGDYLDRFMFAGTECAAPADAHSRNDSAFEAGSEAAGADGHEERFEWPTLAAALDGERRTVVGLLRWSRYTRRPDAVPLADYLWETRTGTYVALLRRGVQPPDDTPAVLPVTTRTTAADLLRFLQRYSAASLEVADARELRCRLDALGVVAVLDGAEWGSPEQDPWLQDAGRLAHRLRTAAPLVRLRATTTGPAGVLPRLSSAEGGAEVRALEPLVLSLDKLIDPLAIRGDEGEGDSFPEAAAATDWTGPEYNTLTVLLAPVGDGPMVAAPVLFPSPPSPSHPAYPDAAERWRLVVGGALEDAVSAKAALLRSFLPLRTADDFREALRWGKSAREPLLLAAPPAARDGSAAECAQSVRAVSLEGLPRPAAWRLVDSHGLAAELDGVASVHWDPDGDHPCAPAVQATPTRHCRAFCVLPSGRVLRVSPHATVPSWPPRPFVLRLPNETELLQALQDMRLHPAVAAAAPGAASPSVLVPLRAGEWSLWLAPRLVVPALVRARPPGAGAADRAAACVLVVTPSCGLCANVLKAVQLLGECEAAARVPCTVLHVHSATDAGEVSRWRDTFSALGVSDAGEALRWGAGTPLLLLFNATHVLSPLPLASAALRHDWVAVVLHYMRLIDSGLNVAESHHCVRRYILGHREKLRKTFRLPFNSDE